MMATPPPQGKPPGQFTGSDKGTMVDELAPRFMGEVNETGHIQELERNFSLLSVCSVGIVTGNTWAALGGKSPSRKNISYFGYLRSGSLSRYVSRVDCS
jgi:hypothetical protein